MLHSLIFMCVCVCVYLCTCVDWGNCCGRGVVMAGVFRAPVVEIKMAVVAVVVLGGGGGVCS